MTPLVSAIVPAYNAEQFLARALDSALAQTLQASEIVVTNDGSTDGTGALADSYATRYPDRVRVVHQSNGGLVAARNAAIAAARGQYFALLDADDLWLPHHLEESVKVLGEDDALGLVHANIEFMDIEARPLSVPRRTWPEDTDAFLDILLRRRDVSCPTVVFRRSVVDRIGLFDPAFNRLGCEDRDMWLRVARVSGLRYLDSVHARYRIGHASMSRNLEKMQRARMILVDKHTATGPGRPWRRQAVAALHRMAGDELAETGRRTRAMGAYLRAIARDPAAEATWRAVARCILRPNARIRSGI
jgi:glycosyltransferase involved in cell wall biosynthesis